MITMQRVQVQRRSATRRPADDPPADRPEYSDRRARGILARLDGSTKGSRT